MTNTPRLRIGISQCLLGDHVRYDGGHKRDPFLAGMLSRFVEWVPVCPEVEVGLGTPREKMQLEGSAASPRLMTLIARVDLTRAMARFSERRVRELEALDLCGYVFKANSPSCGIANVPIHTRRGTQRRNGAGLFARAFMKHFPHIPIEDESRLRDPIVRENFLERVRCYRCWRDVVKNHVTQQSIVAFHVVNQYLVLAHSRSHYRSLDRLVANARRYRPRELAQRYGRLLMEALKIPATVSKHAAVLQRLTGVFADRVPADERAALQRAIDRYRRGLTSRTVPSALIQRYVNRFKIRSLQQQLSVTLYPTGLPLA